MTQDRRDFAFNTAIGATVVVVAALLVLWIAAAFIVGSVHLFTWIGGVG